MQGIAQKILAAPERYSVDMLRRAVETGLLPAYVGIPLIQAKMQAQQQGQRFATLGQPSPDQQPTIAEQVMGQAGVDALPTNLPEQYAGGGIVAFDKGGEVERFSGGGMSMLQRIAEDYERNERAARSVVPTREAVAAQQPRYSSPEMRDAILAENALYYGAPTPTPAATAAPAAAAQQRPAAPAAPRAGITTLPNAAAAATKTPLPTLARPEGQSVEERTRELFGNLNQQMQGINEDTDRRIRENRNLLTGKPFEEYRSQLEAEARQAGAERADAKNMALVKAGLAMMAGTSRHALTNIGQGAMAGVADWQAAAKDLKKAERERRKEFALIEQAARAEKMGEIDREERLLDASRNRGLAALGATTDAIQRAYGLDRGEAIKVAEANFNLKGQGALLDRKIAAEQAENALERANRLEVAGIGAAATLGASQNRARDPNAVTPGVQTEMYRRRIELQEPARAFALKQLGLKTEPPIPGPNAGPSDPAVLNYTRYRDLMERYIESNIPAPQGRAAPPASSAAPAAPGQPSGLSIVNVRPG
jgi:hypothetical protein